MSGTSQSSAWNARRMLLGVGAFAMVLLTPQSSYASRFSIGGLCLDTDGTYVFLAQCAIKDSQMWFWRDADKRVLLVPIPDLTTPYTLVNHKYQKCLDAWGAKLNSGDKVGLYACKKDAPNQMWGMERDSGLIKVGFSAKGTGIKCLAVPNANFKVGQRLIIWDCADKNKTSKDLRRRSQTFKPA